MEAATRSQTLNLQPAFRSTTHRGSLLDDTCPSPPPHSIEEETEHECLTEEAHAVREAQDGDRGEGVQVVVDPEGVIGDTGEDDEEGYEGEIATVYQPVIRAGAMWS
jgi:hypothetical protein